MVASLFFFESDTYTVAIMLKIRGRNKERRKGRTRKATYWFCEHLSGIILSGQFSCKSNENEVNGGAGIGISVITNLD